MPNVTIIPATVRRSSAQQGSVAAMLRVAAYARVSTDSAEQLTSYDAQVDYYTRHIKEREGWEFAGIYTDEGITATNTNRRDGFNSMVADALAGRIDLIVTKSVSRFARNTVDSLVTVRRLKEKGVEVYFEKENIYTLDSKGELLITIMSSLAQEESRSISENVTWGQRKRMADGKVTMPYKRFLGYDKGEDGLPSINEGEAETVRLIYRLFLEGGTPHSIALRLTDEGIPTPGGKARWHSTDEYSRTVYQCNDKFRGGKRCSTPHLTEDEIKSLFVAAANRLLADRDALLADLAEVKAAVFDMAELTAEREVLRAEMEIVSGLVQKCIEENARIALDQEAYRRRYDALAARFDAAKAQLAEADVAIADKTARGKAIDAFISALRAQDGPVSAFDERLWHSLVEKVTVYVKDDVIFTFRDGTVIKA